MITIKTDEDIKKLKESGQILKDTLELCGKAIKVGMSTMELNNIAENYIFSKNAIPSCLNYEGYKYATCISINEEVVHGMPNNHKIIHDGDIVSVDICVTYKGMVSDATRTFMVGNVKPKVKQLVEDTQASFFEGIKNIKAGSRVGDIGHAIQKYCEYRGYGVVRDLTGHGVGYEVHEDPYVPNFGKENTGDILKENMVIAVEPMITLGTHKVYESDNGWTIITQDHKCASHYENTIVIKKDGVEIVTL